MSKLSKKVLESNEMYIGSLDLPNIEIKMDKINLQKKQEVEKKELGKQSKWEAKVMGYSRLTWIMISSS